MSKLENLKISGQIANLWQKSYPQPDAKDRLPIKVERVGDAVFVNDGRVIHINYNTGSSIWQTQPVGYKDSQVNPVYPNLIDINRKSLYVTIPEKENPDILRCTTYDRITGSVTYINQIDSIKKQEAFLGEFQGMSIFEGSWYIISEDKVVKLKSKAFVSKDLEEYLSGSNMSGEQELKTHINKQQHELVTNHLGYYLLRKEAIRGEKWEGEIGLRKLDNNGDDYWRQVTLPDQTNSISILENRLYIGTQTQDLYALEIF
ncbi:MAG: hypothetical protein ACI83O_000575 [Patescibacteria group bacterium]|jgi:hypothetical protein